MSTDTAQASAPRSPAAPSAAHHPHHDLEAHEVHFADGFKRDYPITWWATMLGPFVATAILLSVLSIQRGGDFVLKLAGTALVTFFGLGRFVIIFGSDAPKIDLEDVAIHASKFNFLTRAELFTMVSWMDMCAATLLIFHAGFLYKIPKLGPRLLALREEGEFFMRYQPWVRRFTFIGLVIFVTFPIAATGSVAGSIFGRLLGMSRWATMTALVCGTLIGNSIMLVIGKAVSKVPFFNPNNPLNLVAGAGLIIIVLFILNWRYQKIKKQYALANPTPDAIAAAVLNKSHAGHDSQPPAPPRG
ncbi:MAG: small multi-drug export protein [Phycisphaeraceae bacterium]|nr:small multi-drug export protein [Phycisphaeraceae bacterium]